MAHLRPLVGVALLALAGTSHAFVFPSPPPGFGGTPGNWTFSPPSGAQQIDTIIRQPAHLPVPTGGGGNVKLPVAYKLGPHAGKIAAAAIFAAPAVGGALAIAGWLITAKLVYDEVEKIWRERQDVGDETGYEYRVGEGSWTTQQQACQQYVTSKAWGGFHGELLTCSYPNGSYKWIKDSNGADYGTHNFTIERQEKTVPGTCPTGWTATPAGCLSPALTQPQFVDKLSREPMPEGVPGELPKPTPLPVAPPVVNPTPGPNPVPQPYFVPTGDPVPNPQYNPEALPSEQNQPFVQPGIRIKPSPTLTEPWRVDLEPVNVPRQTADPVPEGELNPPGAQPKPEETQSLCEKHPDIVACQKLGELQPETLQTKTVTLTIERSDGFGPSTGTCPAPKTATIMGKQVAFQWDLLCDFANGIRPLLIGFAYLSAALAFMGLTRRGD